MLEARDAGGHSTSTDVAVVIDGQMKIGHFSVTWDDLTIPTAGIPITLTRTYDTRQRHQPLDFGQGWSLGYQDIRVTESRRAGFAWQVQEFGSGFALQRCARPNGDRQVAIRWPDGEVDTFVAKADPECRGPFDGYAGYAQLVYEALPGSFGTLEQLDYGQLQTKGHPFSCWEMKEAWQEK